MKNLVSTLTDFDLVNIRNKKNEDLSIGQRRRVQVAREFMHDMDLLFLDEPTVGLDPTARRNLLDYLKSKVKTGLTIFYTTHVLTEAEYICDEIAIINNGKIITVDTPEELKNRFGQEKTIKIHISARDEKISELLENIKDCKIEFKTGTDITIHSTESSALLLQVLQILNTNNIDIEEKVASLCPVAIPSKTKKTTTATPSLNNDSPEIFISKVLGTPTVFNIPITAIGSVGEIKAPNNKQ